MHDAGLRSDLPLQDLIRRTGVEVDYRFKLESIDLWETVVITNNKNRQKRSFMAPGESQSISTAA